MKQMDREVAARLGRETKGILAGGGYAAPGRAYVNVRPAVDSSRSATVEYPPARLPAAPPLGSLQTRFSVENETVLAVGRRMAHDGAVAALNFASATSPGGGFLSGARAQEESIARSSGLFAVLEGRDMYEFHRSQWDAMYTDYVIFSPDVPMFRNDDGELLAEPWPLSIVTCPAVNGAALRRYAPHRMGEVESVMESRTAKMLSVAAAHGVKRFILGAWGCGAFGLEPEMMARIFRDAFSGLFRGVFDEVVFAVTDWSPERRFIAPFERTFGSGSV